MHSGGYSHPICTLSGSERKRISSSERRSNDPRPPDLRLDLVCKRHQVCPPETKWAESRWPVWEVRVVQVRFHARDAAGPSRRAEHGRDAGV